MMKKSFREGFHTITPYLVVEDAERLFDFIKQAFGAVETYRSLQPDGRVKHAEFRIGNSMLMAAEAPEMAMPCNLHLYIDDPDDFYFRALQAGGSSIMEPNNRPMGERLAGVRDPSGNMWWMSSPI